MIGEFFLGLSSMGHTGLDAKPMTLVAGVTEGIDTQGAEIIDFGCFLKF